MHKITLTVEKKGYFTVEKKQCPNCGADWYFLFDDNKYHGVGGFAASGEYSIPKDVIQCQVCFYRYNFSVEP